MNVLLTGATGFIGQYLYAALKENDLDIRVLGRTKPDSVADYVVWDMTEPLDIGALKGIDTVFHLAGKAHTMASGWQQEECYFPVNIAATRRLLEAAKYAGVRRFIYFSSVKATANPGRDRVDESDQSLPESMYGRSKRMAEHLVLEGGYVPEPVVLRPTMVYGATEKGNLPRMIRAIAKGYFPLLPDTGNGRSMIHVDDVVQAAILAATSSEAIGKVYILTDGCTYDARQMHAWICAALHKNMPRHAWPLWLMKGIARLGDGIGQMKGARFVFDSDVLDKLIGASMYSSRKIEQELGFSARRSLRESLPEMIEYLT